MSSVGDSLRQERRRQGLELGQVAQQTKISLRYLEAIELDDFSGLPGGFFYRSFVKQYAEFLGIDDESLSADIDRITETTPSFVAQSEYRVESLDLPPLPALGKSSRSSRLPLAIVFLVTAIAASTALYALWQRYDQSRNEPEAANSAAADSNPTPAPPIHPGITPAPAAAEPSGQSSPPPATGQTATEKAESAPATQTATPPAGETPTAPPPVATSPGMHVKLELMATEEVWVSVTADGKEVIKRVLKPGETRTVQGVETVTLLTGNAGGLVVTANGKVISPVGPRGQVRIVEVSPNGAQVRGPNKGAL